jgi:tetratricopeptide (TPR) repeat protein
LGEVYSIQNELEKTEENFRLAIERGLENEILHFEWGKAYVRFFDFKKAKEQFVAALEIDGEFQDAKIGMALVNAHSGDFSQLQELKEKNGENVYIQEGIALERFADGKYEDAIDMFKKALRTDPKQKYNYLNIARVYNAWNNKDKTREFYEKFIQECPTYFDGIVEYSKWLINISDFADAQRKLRKADKLRKNDLEVMNLLFYTSYRLVKENVCEYNIKEAISIAEKTKSIGNFDYETEKVELENLLVNIQGNN